MLGGFVPVPLATALIYEPDNSAAKKLHSAWQIFDQPLVLTNEKLAAPIRNLAAQLKVENLKLATLDQLLPSISKTETDYHSAKPDEIALMLLTSGSTGVPKTVKLSHQNILNSIAATSQMAGFTSQDISLNWLPLDHPGPLIRCVIRMVYLGCQQIHAPTAMVLQEPLQWLDWLDRDRVTTTWAPNFAFALLNDRAEEIKKGHWNLTSLKSLLNTAEPIVPQTAIKLWELLNPHGLSKTAMHSSWGMAETTSGVTHSEQYLSDFSTDENNSFAELGLPVPGIALRIVDEQDQIVTEQTIGYLQVKGATVTSGYEQNLEANQEAFTADGWFKTGDLGFLTQGRLTITGRIKDVIIINGNNYYSHEIEGVVEEIEGVEVSYTAACGIRQPNSNTDRLGIFFHTNISEDETLLELLKKIQQQIVRKLGINPAYLIPVEPAAIPKTSIGKIQRSQLKQGLKRVNLRQLSKE
ncbi:MAG: AMP-binding protein [Hydrococcus sp. SU_1_0]|nr:AMP-binding protein [Hydrococcus sp. SU_1_0]